MPPFQLVFAAINKVAQKGDSVVICSASLGGQPDGNGADGQLAPSELRPQRMMISLSEAPNPYNRDGALMVWQGTPETLPGHHRDIPGEFLTF